MYRHKVLSDLTEGYTIHLHLVNGMQTVTLICESSSTSDS